MVQCLFWEDLLKKLNLNKVFIVCGSWKGFQSSSKWSYYICFEVEGICYIIFVRLGYVTVFVRYVFSRLGLVTVMSLYKGCKTAVDSELSD